MGILQKSAVLQGKGVVLYLPIKGTDGAKFAVFCRFLQIVTFLGITAFRRRRKLKETSDFR